jgi:SpoVK/Ycf46/Vps4 family AAA+-type ATPase
MIQRPEKVVWEDIVGLDHAKNTIIETVILPLQRPDLFTGLRQPVKGVLLFGPPGTGKTMIGRCIASQAQATFLCISASSITSKWVGESEKLVKALFAVARVKQPTVIFVDEVDSVLTQRTDGEAEASRRIKTEFLVQFDGVANQQGDRILFIGATNRPQELDEAVRRRLVKRLYIPLPGMEARRQMVRHLLHGNRHCLRDPEDLDTIAATTEGYSGSDMRALCAEAAMGPMRALGVAQLGTARESELRDIAVQDFCLAAKQIRASVSERDLQGYQDWNGLYGTMGL